MAMSPAMRMLMLTGNKHKDSEYSDDNGRKMIGFDRDRRRERMRYDTGPYYEGGYDDRMYMPTYPHMPPSQMMGGMMSGGREGNSYGDIYAHGTIYAPNAMNKPSRGFDKAWYNDEDDHSVDEHKAREWVRKMSSGEHFKPEITDQYRSSACPDCDKWEFYTAMNAMYSDHYKTAQKMGVDKPDFYAHMAKDFLMDEDAKPGKLAKYMREIAK